MSQYHAVDPARDRGNVAGPQEHGEYAMIVVRQVPWLDGKSASRGIIKPVITYVSSTITSDCPTCCELAPEGELVW